MSFKTRKDRILAKFFTRYPAFMRAWAKSSWFVTSIDIPWAPFTKDLEECRVALVTTAGVHLNWQPPFNMENKDGDPTFREIPSWVDPEDLRITHNYYDHQDADRDINVVFPIERLGELEAEGIIGRIAPCHFSFMGHITGGHLETLIKATAPKVAGFLKVDGVDAVFLTPAWGTCNQSVGLIQRAIEAEGIPTISISLNRTITEKVRPPRTLLVGFPLGHPMGNPFDEKLQRKVLMDGLKYLKEIEKPGTIVDLTKTYGIKGGECIFCRVKGEGICHS